MLSERKDPSQVCRTQSPWHGQWNLLDPISLVDMAQVPLRSLGKDGPKVSALGFGAMGLSTSYGKVDNDEERFRVLDRALELGATFWDTSDVCLSALLIIQKLESRTYLFQMAIVRIS